LVLSDLDAIIADPGAALDELREQVRSRQGDAAQFDGRRQHLHARLRESEEARRDIMALVRRRLLPVEEAEAQLESIAAEAAEARRVLDTLESRAALAEEAEASLLETARLLGEIQDEWARWRREMYSDDEPTRRDAREQIAAVVSRLLVEVRARQDGTARRRYAFDGREICSRPEKDQEFYEERATQREHEAA
jgi:hypothetical protein